MEEECNRKHSIVGPTDIIGEWGPWQKKLLFSLNLLYLVAAFQNLGILFHAAKTNYWCVEANGEQLNVSVRNISINEQCKIYGDRCNKWEYDTSTFKTIIAEFDLVCDRSWFASAAGSVYQIGYAISAILSGIISDKFGRLPTLKAAVLLEIFSGFNQALAVSIWHFLIARLFLGIGAFARFFTSYMLIVECIGTKHRAQVAVTMETGWSLGMLLLPILAYFFPNFRNLQLIVSSYQILCIYILWKLPESLRWQLTHGKFREAEIELTNAAKIKAKYSDEEIQRKIKLLEEHVEKSEEKYEKARKQTILDLWREPSLLKNCLVLYYVYPTFSFIYYGLSFTIGDLGGNLFINCFIYAFAEACALVFSFLTIKRLKRRLIIITLCWSLALSCCLIAFLLWFNTQLILRIIFGMFGKFCIVSTFQVLFLVASELIPTTLRQRGTGSFSFAARFGSITAPFTQELSSSAHPYVSMAVFAALASINGSLLFFIRETKGVEIPDTIAEAVSTAKSRPDVHDSQDKTAQEKTEDE